MTLEIYELALTSKYYVTNLEFPQYNLSLFISLFFHSHWIVWHYSFTETLVSHFWTLSSSTISIHLIFLNSFSFLFLFGFGFRISCRLQIINFCFKFIFQLTLFNLLWSACNLFHCWRSASMWFRKLMRITKVLGTCSTSKS